MDNEKKTSVGSGRPTTTTNAFQTQQKELFSTDPKKNIVFEGQICPETELLSAFLIDNVIVHIFAATPM